MGKALRVLLVEDSEDDALLLVRALQRGGIEPQYRRVDEEAAFRDALTDEAWDIIIADYVLPRFSGISAIRITREMGIDVPIIMVSGKMGEETAVEAMRASAQDYLLKGNLARLVPAIQRELQDAQVRRERQLAEEALRKRERDLARSQAVAHVGNWEWDIQHDVLTLSNEVYCIFALERNTFTGKIAEILTRVHPDDTEYAARLIATIRAGESISPFDIRIVHPDGAVHTLHVQTAGDEFDAKGQPQSIFGVVQDITERKQTEEALRESEARFRTLADSAPVLIWVNGLEGAEFVNRAYLEFFGVESAVDVERYKWADFIHPDDRDAYLQRYQDCFAHQALFEATFRLRRYDGVYRWMKSVGQPRLSLTGEFLGYVGSTLDITDVKEAEEELQATRRRLSDILESIQDALYTVDRDWRITYLNPRAKEIWEMQGKEILGKILCEEFPTVGTASNVYRQLQRAMQERQPVHFDFNSLLLHAWVEIHAYPAADGGLTVYYRDISERKQAEEERERLLAELDAIITSVADGLIVYSPTGEIIRSNPAADRILGFTYNYDACEVNIPELWACRCAQQPDGTPLPLEEVPAYLALQGQAVQGRMLCFSRKDGSRLWVSVSAAPIYAPDGHLLGVVGTYTDFTVNLELQQQIQRRIAELDATINAVADGLIIYSPTGEILIDNPAARRMLDGMLLDEEYDSKLSSWLSRRARTVDGKRLAPEDSPGAHAASGETILGEVLIFRRKDGTDIYVSVTAAPIRQRDETIIGVVSTYTDITALHELQDQQKILIHLVSHDLRAPLTIIKGHIQLLEELIAQAGVNGMIAQGLKAVDRGVERMNVMIQDLVDAARTEGRQLELKCETVDLRAYLPEYIRRSATAIDTARIQLDLPSDLPPVPADYNRLERILTNLLTNALKYSDPGTPVLVRARQMDDHIEVSMTDQGHGIDPEDLPHLFDRFFRAKGTKAEGIGLGLYITKQLVEAHGGHIWVVSEVGIGSTFYFTLPVAR